MSLLTFSLHLFGIAFWSSIVLLGYHVQKPKDYLVSYMAKTETGWLVGSTTLTATKQARPQELEAYCTKLLAENQPPVVGKIAILSCVKL